MYYCSSSSAFFNAASNSFFAALNWLSRDAIPGLLGLASASALTSKYPDFGPLLKNRWQWMSVCHGTFCDLSFLGRPIYLLFHLCASQQCSCICCMEQQTYEHRLPTTSNVHRIPFFFSLANAVMGLDVDGGNGNSHCLNASLLPINPSISATASTILSCSLLSNLCWGLAAKCAWIKLGNTAC